jgi:EAL domain-containing protein (putative c-di-GMP-specific phosphodiesterase class I)
MLEPAQFIPVAEEIGVIRELDRWALARGARQMVRWRRTAPGLRLAVNVSARHLGLHGFPEDAAQILARAGLPPQAFTLEVTEAALTTDPDAARAHLWALRELGVRISLDDFGAGASALSHLRSFPVDELKIDRSFVEAAHRGPDDLALLRGVVDLGRALRLTTVAEGVEEAGQLATLRDLGCEYGQGYLFARPLAEAAVGPWLAGQGLDMQRSAS